MTFVQLTRDLEPEQLDTFRGKMAEMFPWEMTETERARWERRQIAERTGAIQGTSELLGQMRRAQAQR